MNDFIVELALLLFFVIYSSRPQLRRVAILVQMMIIVGATPTARPEASNRDVGVAPTAFE